MRTLVQLPAMAGLLLAILGPGTAAQAQLSRTFVSAATGNDANNCDRPTPCRTFQGAHDKTNDLGEMIVLDPGGYGGLTITKSISIVNDGVGETSILVSGGTVGIRVNAGAASYVNLRGITIQGIGFGGGSGLGFNSGFSLTMTNCVIRNHTGPGIAFGPAGDGRLAVSNTLVADNGGSGISVNPGGAGAVRVSLDRVETYNNSLHGIFVDGEFSGGTVNVTVADSVMASNSGAGVRANSNQSQSSSTQVMVVRSVAAHNVVGLYAQGPTATLRVSQSTVTGNNVSWSAFGSAVLASYRDNNIDGNLDGDPAPLAIITK